jgi:hypothetical protein
MIRWLFNRVKTGIILPYLRTSRDYFVNYHFKAILGVVVSVVGVCVSDGKESDLNGALRLCDDYDFILLYPGIWDFDYFFCILFS